MYASRDPSRKDQSVLEQILRPLWIPASSQPLNPKPSNGSKLELYKGGGVGHKDSQHGNEMKFDMFLA